MIPFVYSTNINHAQQILRPFSDTVYNMVLSANTEDHITIPSGATMVIISATSNVYMLIGAGVTAAIPVSDVTNGTGSVLNSAGYLLKPTDTRISCISPNACIVTLEFYS